MFFKSFIQSIFLSLIVILLVCCGDNEENAPREIKVKARKNIDIKQELEKELQTFLKNPDATFFNLPADDSVIVLPFLQKLYTGSNPIPIWLTGNNFTPIGDTLFNLLKNARYYGLIPADYHVGIIDSLVEHVLDVKDSTYNVSGLARAELLLSDAYLKFGAHLNKGRFNPDTMILEWNPAKLDSAWLTVLKKGIQFNKLRWALDSLEPDHEGFILLQKEFRKYLVKMDTVKWDSIQFTNISDTAQFLKSLVNRLTITGDYDSTVKGNDSVKLAKALKHFQKRMNLDPDGKIGKFTRLGLMLSKETTIRQMEMALERWRWEPTRMPKIYFKVNIPTAMLTVYEKDTLVLKSRVVVGKPETQTPELASKLNYMIVYPYWNVPFKIATEEILPAVQRDTSYLRKKNFEVIGTGGKILDPHKIKWKNITKGNMYFMFRQRIGGDNSLGILKFNFNNKYGVYMHDTNSKRYFQGFYRYQSHGCIRLEKFFDVAKFIIRDDSLRYRPDSLLEYFLKQEQKKITIRKPLPIFVRYYSAEVDSAGKLQLYVDIYRRDEKLMRMAYKERK